MRDFLGPLGMIVLIVAVLAAGVYINVALYDACNNGQMGACALLVRSR